ncbi:MAG: prenyltransferase/squalene oxidase repeat-containing protein, partial [Planctomycetia bacterium]|nr:prenyltransferase/squalene oxidase repeat-containing protein [Planctomycetia bacterium]
MDTLKTLIQQKIERSQNWFFSQQNPDGHWRAELEGDALLQGELIIILAFLGLENTPLAKRLANQLIKTQAEDGGWPMFTGGKSTIPNTVKAYFALKLTGHPLSAEYMQRARRCVLRMGGADKVNSFTRFYLAILGQVPYSQCPAVPPEMILLPKWAPINLYSISSWTRTIVVPLSIVSALQPVREIPVEKGIRELFIKKPEDWGPLRAPGKPENPGFFSWDMFFRAIDRVMKAYQKFPLKPTRKIALKWSEEWLWEHCQNSDGPGAIQPPIMWGLVAMKALGRSDDDERTRYFWDQLMNLVIDCPEEDTARCEPCLSPVWDTIITMRALAAGGLRAGDERVDRAINWVLDHQIHVPGDWSKSVKCKPCMWCFEYHNDFYPDTDDTAMSIMALRGMVPERGVNPRLDDAVDGALKWLRAMQNSDGGWGAFDRNNNKEFLTQVPFADHNAMTDPSTPDLTSRILECFGTLGFRVGQGDKNLDR